MQVTIPMHNKDLPANPEKHHLPNRPECRRTFCPALKTMTAFTFKIETLYVACSPELGVVSCGHYQDEALNNLTDEIRQCERVRTGTKRIANIWPMLRDDDEFDDPAYQYPVFAGAFHTFARLDDHLDAHSVLRPCKNCGKTQRGDGYHRF